MFRSTRNRAAAVPLLAWLLAFGGAGCSSVAVHSDAAPGVDFSAYHTFAQAPPPKTANANLPGYSEITGDHIQAAIAHELETKGFSSAPVDKADLLVAFSINGQRRTDIESAGGFGWYGGWGGDTYTVNYTEGTLIIDIFDAHKKSLIWHAYGQTNIYGHGDHSSQVDPAVQSILEGFPPKPGS